MTARIGRVPRAPGLLRIGDAARAVGVSPSTLRLWERQGLVAPLRPAGGERRYGPDELTRLRCIRRLRTVEGLNAAGIRRALGSDDVEAARSVPAAAHGPAAADGPAAARGSPAGRDPAEDDHAAAVLVGARLRAMRTAAGLSLRAVAARTGLSASFVSGLERGVSSASVAALVRLATTYQTTVAAIVDGPAAGVPGPGAAAAGTAPDAAAAPGPGASAASDRVVRDGARPALETGRGVRIEELAMLPTRLRPQLVRPRSRCHLGGHLHPRR